MIIANRDEKFKDGIDDRAVQQGGELGIGSSTSGIPLPQSAGRPGAYFPTAHLWGGDSTKGVP